MKISLLLSIIYYGGWIIAILGMFKEAYNENKRNKEEDKHIVEVFEVIENLK